MASFWDDLFPDFGSFDAALRPLLGPATNIAGRTWLTDQLILQTWLQPFSPEGAFVRGLLVLGKPASSQAGDFQTAWGGMSDWGVAGSSGGTWDWGGGNVALVIANTYRVSVVALNGGREIVNVFGLAGSSSGQEAAACAAMQTAWKVASGPLSLLPSAAYTLSYFEAVDLSTTSGGIYRITDTTAGSSANAVSTSAASALIKWNGNTRNKSNRGRTYFGPIREDQVNSDGKTISAAAKAAFGTAFTNMRTSLSGSGFTLCILSRKLNSASNVTLQTVEDTIATQRRRVRN